MNTNNSETRIRLYCDNNVSSEMNTPLRVIDIGITINNILIAKVESCILCFNEPFPTSILNNQY
mgnify:CR=1 FL=1